MNKTAKTGIDDLSDYFAEFRAGIVGHDANIMTPYGSKPLIALDWTARGRNYGPIERVMSEDIAKMCGNTHSGATATARAMTEAYEDARQTIKRHVGAGPGDVLIFEGFGMTGAIVRLQYMMGLKLPLWAERYITLQEHERPVVFVTHMEHHSNHTSWLETIAAKVVVIPPGSDGLPSLSALEQLLAEHDHHSLKIGAFSACSNVTGLEPPIPAMAALMHAHGGICIVDYAASAPYVSINMHPPKPAESIDAIVFSPHKFLGGPGSSGVLIMNKSLIASPVPFRPGGGTVEWTNAWGGRSYVHDIEHREDGGTPGIEQAIRASLAIKLKEQMGMEKIAVQKKQLLSALFRELDSVPGLRIMADNMRQRQAIVSFTLEGIHYGLTVALLNDRFGIQSRGGCSCAGTYGHYLFEIDQEQSRKITDRIDAGDNSIKPGWTRVSLHPTTTFAEISYLGEALREIVAKHDEWRQDYVYDPATNEFTYVERT